MKRNKTGQLNVFKRTLAQERKLQQRPIYSPANVPWEHDYYHFKAELLSVTRKNNEDIGYFLSQYRNIPSLFNLRQLQSQLSLNCRKIDEIDRWAAKFQFTYLSPTQTQLERNLIKHFQQELAQAIRKVFLIRQQMTRIHQETAGDPLGQSHNISFHSVNTSFQNINQRNEAIREVSNRIEGLNAILRRMGDLVAEQEGLVNRIDQNMTSGQKNVKLGNAQLSARAARQTCTSEENDGFFGCSKKVNAIINALYFINLALIVVLVLRNL